MMTKDLQGISDRLKQEALAETKCRFYCAQMQDPQLKAMADTLAQHHRMHYDAMYQYLCASIKEE